MCDVHRRIHHMGKMERKPLPLVRETLTAPFTINGQSTISPSPTNITVNNHIPMTFLVSSHKYHRPDNSTHRTEHKFVQGSVSAHLRFSRGLTASPFLNKC